MAKMEIWKINRKHGDFTQVFNEPFRDKALSMKTRGFLITLLTLPSKWEFSVEGMAHILPDGECAIRSAIKELMDNGYCTRIAVRENGRFVCWQYNFYEYKRENATTNTSAPFLGFPQVEKPQVENQGQYHITSISDNKNIDKEKNIKESKSSLVLPFHSQEFVSIWQTLTKQPKWRNKTADALRLALKKLGAHTEADAIRMMENSIEGGWQGLFELKDNERNTGHTTAAHDRIHFGSGLAGEEGVSSDDIPFGSDGLPIQQIRA